MKTRQSIIKMTSKANYKVYMDVQIGATAAGRITFELFNDLTSKTSQNFRGLCTGQFGKANSMKLHYLNTKFHKIIDGFVIQGGDISNSGAAMGGYSIYGRTFVDQSFARTHSCAGLLSMANSGRDTNASQFYITLKACPHLDGKSVVFGQVIDGMEIVKKIAKVPIDKNNKPKYNVLVIDCGQIDDFRNFLRYDPFRKQVFDQIRKARQKIINDQHAIRKLLSEGLDPNTAYDLKKNLETCQRNLASLQKRQAELQYEKSQQKIHKSEQKLQQQGNEEGRETVEINEKFRQKFGDKAVDKFMELKLKINSAKASINKAVLLEQKKDNNDHYIKQQKKIQWLAKRADAEKQILAKGLNADKQYMNRLDHKKEQNQKPDLSFGWNIFGQQAYYKAYDKRCLGLKKDGELYEAQMKGEYTKISDQALNSLQQDVLKQQQKRSKFSNVKIYDQDETVNYINDRNRKFNLKLERNYGEYASSTKTALQLNSLKK